MTDQSLMAPSAPLPRRLDYTALMARATRDDEMISLAARCILQEFDLYYVESRGIPAQAQAAFETRDPGRSIALSRRRLSIYSESIHALAAQLLAACPALAADPTLWQQIESHYLPMTAGRYEEDLAIAFLHSSRRMVVKDEWQPVDYSFGRAARRASPVQVYIHRDFSGGDGLRPAIVREILEIPDFKRAFRDLQGDSERVAERVNEELGFDGHDLDVVRVIQMIDAGFFRNRGCYLVGRIVLRERSAVPFVLSLENDESGIFVDAVLTREAAIHNIFSSTLANFHVNDPHYHELAAFLHSVMPGRALGLHYSTIGFNHVGKVAVMDELRGELDASKRTVSSIGARLSRLRRHRLHRALIGLCAEDHSRRRRPTATSGATFAGIESVLDKYRRVHEINRTGSMLDNIIYYNIRLEQSWFGAELLEELANFAGRTVSLQDGSLTFKHLIVQPKMVPLPLFLETAKRADAEAAVINLGHCIKNNAAANIFNKDLDGRNYGVSHFHKVYLFDYDALEVFTDVKIRTNLGREDGEEDIPDWFFEDGIIFLPEEIESGLRIHDRGLRRLFHDVHGDLSTTDYWENLQAALKQGRVPRIRIYSEDCKLTRESEDS